MICWNFAIQFHYIKITHASLVERIKFHTGLIFEEKSILEAKGMPRPLPKPAIGEGMLGAIEETNRELTLKL